MKTKLNTHHLPHIAAGLGAAAFLLRIALKLLGQDEKGLLVPGHPLSLLVWAVTAAALVLLAAAVWPLDGSNKYSHNFAPSTAAAIGCFVMAGGAALTVIFGWNPRSQLDMIRSIAGLLAVPALVVLGLHRQKGKQPYFLFHGVVCLFLILYAVSHYQLWSSRPQMQDWFFSMAASIMLTLFAYYQTAFDVAMGKRRMQLLTGLLACFFCMAALADGEDMMLYAGGAVWTLTGLCSLTPVPSRRKNPITETAQEEKE